jgi:hypothetical protein
VPVTFVSFSANPTPAASLPVALTAVVMKATLTGRAGSGAPWTSWISESSVGPSKSPSWAWSQSPYSPDAANFWFAASRSPRLSNIVDHTIRPTSREATVVHVEISRPMMPLAMPATSTAAATPLGSTHC